MLAGLSQRILWYDDAAMLWSVHLRAGKLLQCGQHVGRGCRVSSWVLVSWRHRGARPMCDWRILVPRQLELIQCSGEHVPCWLLWHCCRRVSVRVPNVLRAMRVPARGLLRFWQHIRSGLRLLAGVVLHWRRCEPDRLFECWILLSQCVCVTECGRVPARVLWHVCERVSIHVRDMWGALRMQFRLLLPFCE